FTWHSFSTGSEMTYSGKDWPLEPLQEQRNGLKDGEYHIFLAGEYHEVEAVFTILTTLSYLRRFGRPFQRLYKLVRNRPSSVSSVLKLEVPFKHQSFTISQSRVTMLRMLLDYCGDGTVYEIVHREDGSLISEKNFPEYE